MGKKFAFFVLLTVVIVCMASVAMTKSKAELSIDGAKGGQTYKLIATGLKIGGEVQEDVVYEFTMPELGDLLDYKLRTADGTTHLIADGASSALLVFELLDSNGDIVTTAGDVEIAFTTTFGSFAERRVTTQNGIANIMLFSESKYVPKAQIQATIVEAEDESLIGRKATLELFITVGMD
ncbi:hypothetical protein J31TS6_22230 [Brevibacillus reuszeri]|uniref:hypothetical protein n=1 Tax=Brevibacillus reuszeri TaxID=54915 RepID=UPI001AFD2B4E|nr:hypothetical protein [Brevibacillus reuszeri]GIO06195.1 hypothetical protein J31TS6_22230 [Brevibacillus reuszeri]